MFLLRHFAGKRIVDENEVSFLEKQIYRNEKKKFGIKRIDRKKTFIYCWKNWQRKKVDFWKCFYFRHSVRQGVVY